MKIAIIANTAWYLQNFRLNLARALRDQGHEVLFVSPTDSYVSVLTKAGFQHQHWGLAAAGKRPWRELKSVAELRRLLSSSGVEVVFSYTPKANIYAGLALAGKDGVFIPNVSGLGRVFVNPNWLTPLVTRLYRLAFKRAQCVVFQNEDDRSVFRRLGLVQDANSIRVPGSGVDLNRFALTPMPQRQGNDPVRFLFVGRLLKDKGVREFVEAVRLLRQEGSNVHARMLGSSTSDNPAAVQLEELQSWIRDGLVEHIEHCDDVRPWLAAADCVVLPSYREGVPRSLLEAGAMGRPLISTDAPGCRDAVNAGRSGYLCPIKSPRALADAMRSFLSLSPKEQQQMGWESRDWMVQRFDERLVIQRYLEFATGAATGRLTP